ncbi:NAD-dependent epimerase/dehydratase family protein [Solibacillus sp. CAU 1738]|uniref:NAD-dependent epimerase/dehydratase family protein n=1 Tax=Solibacillus sp. CAU 1738 TaxID=3140363 RepID=UPI003260D291
MEMNNKSILITGGYGFVGSVVARKLYEQGAEITIVDNCSTGNKRTVPFPHNAYEMNVEDALCETIFKQHKIDIIIHCAAQTSVTTSMKDPIQDSYSNVFGVIRMLMWAQKYNVEHFVFTSSAAVYGDQLELPITEDRQLNPLSVYGMNKQIGEMYCERWQQFHNLPTLIYRFSNVYGPGANQTDAIIPRITEKIINNEVLTIYGDGNQSRDFIYVDDIANAIIRGVESRLQGIYNISTNEHISLNELIQTVRELGYTLTVNNEQAKDSDIKHSLLSNEKIVKTTQWQPTVSIKEGIQRCIESKNQASAQIS